MRKIAYHLSKEINKKKILDFCESEKLGADELPKTGKVDGNDYVFVITDVEEFLDNVSVDNTRCFISSFVKSIHDCFIINETRCFQSMRIVLDHIYHGGTLWNIMPDLKSDSSIKECHIINNNTEIERVVYFTTRDFIHFCSFSEIEKIRIGFSEMLINAIEHGNLDIKGMDKFKATESGTFQDLINERLSDPRYKDKAVRFCVDFNTERVKITIEDEGYGFDITQLPTTDNANQLKLHGRGILITRAYFDEVIYNDIGNKVTLLKYFPR
ncbi:MAG: ATP-binding protein [Deferribacteraceae bacterium]|jgi:anti-sigma regulatory factor (Ser/Thr protein kinase)|nr:ATP-binding protein [Deferribacteraceae bacterium]